jgi:hypothetical protein
VRQTHDVRFWHFLLILAALFIAIFVVAWLVSPPPLE